MAAFAVLCALVCRLTGTSCHCLCRDPLGAVSLCERVASGKGLLGRVNSERRGEGSLRSYTEARVWRTRVLRGSGWARIWDL